MTATEAMPLLLAGPVLRRCEPQMISLWLVTSKACDWQLSLHQHQRQVFDGKLSIESHQQIAVGRHCYMHFITLVLTQPLTLNRPVDYGLTAIVDEQLVDLCQTSPHLCYPGRETFGFTLQTDIGEVLHGSCRKAHHPCGDGLLQVDKLLQQRIENEQAPPVYLMLSGDQVYVDDVAGPMLNAIHQVIDKLGLVSEPLQGAAVDTAEALYQHPHSYYHRDTFLLPIGESGNGLQKLFWGGKRKPIFTTVNGKNHLVTLAEVLALYLLSWSPVLWRLVDMDKHSIRQEYQPRYREEQQYLQEFVAGLPQVQRALAHIPTYMIFDDHDITDDWNLTRGWEEAAYGHPFSKRIIGNALVGYLLCQGWGNNPQQMSALVAELNTLMAGKDSVELNGFIDRLFDFSRWHYQIDTTPKTLVLDTRTQRWRSESNANKPSGLMDWESLCELQQQLIGEPSVIMVSAAPIYGVKLIEVIQRVFTYLGHALTVDAENWMAHRGTASVILNIFRHHKTPPNFIILSGDVHYSFVYDVKLRFRRNSPRICQITCSGIKNEFPGKLLRLLDSLNQWLYHRRSPLNWFTQRRRMSIRPRMPSQDASGHLANVAGIGRLRLGDNHRTIDASILTHKGEEVHFKQPG